MMKKISIILILLFLSGCIKTWENQWDKKYSENEKIISQEKIILALWDSLTAWYNLDIKDSYPLQLEGLLKSEWYNYKVQNAWVSWDTSKNLLDRIWLYDDINPDIYLVGIWSNDWLRRQSVDEMKTNITLIIEHIKKINPDAMIVLQWMQMPLNVGINYAKDFKKAFEDISQEEKIYFYEFLLKDVATKNQLNLSDWIHPNQQGYAIIAKNIYNFLIEKNLITP